LQFGDIRVTNANGGCRTCTHVIPQREDVGIANGCSVRALGRFRRIPDERRNF
jgi:hypothetical protein